MADLTILSPPAPGAYQATSMTIYSDGQVAWDVATGDNYVGVSTTFPDGTHGGALQATISGGIDDMGSPHTLSGVVRCRSRQRRRSDLIGRPGMAAGACV